MMSSTCFESEGSSSGRRLYVQVRYRLFTCNGISSLVKRHEHPNTSTEFRFRGKQSHHQNLSSVLKHKSGKQDITSSDTLTRVHKPPYWREVSKTQET